MLEQKLTYALSLNNHEKQVLYVISLLTILELLRNNTKDQDLTLSCLTSDSLQIIEVNDKTTKGDVLVKAKALMLELLRNNSETSKKNKKFFEALNLTKDQVENLKDDFMTKETPEQLLKELEEELFPNYVAIFPLSNAWAHTILTGGIILKTGLIESAESSTDLVVDVMLTMLHELSHKKKKLHLANNEFMETPQKMIDLYKIPDRLSTGRQYEIYSFGEEVVLEVLQDDERNEILEYRWPDFTKKIKKALKPEISSFKVSPSKIKGCSEERIPKCGNKFLQACMNARLAEENFILTHLMKKPF